MILTYALTTIIVGAWALKMVNQRSWIINRTPLDIPLLLFLLANILSTIFSIDPHTSIFGYYSRSNGGLLSIISYLLLYWAFVSNMDRAKATTLLKVGLASGFLISLWAIFEHFGISLSCVILRGEFNASCWVQDVQARVFASLGQPNWLASYLAMLIFPALYFYLNESKKYLYFTLLITMYLAFTFTYSRGPTLGLIGGFVVLTVLLFERSRELSISPLAPLGRRILIVLGSFLIINILFGSALTSFRLVSKFAAPVRPGISLPTTQSVGTQLENGGTESGAIRFIVWAGALDIFKAYPIFGSGLETFAYSYYQFRPASHNLTSEWDFLYNKAHNEYLNYLSTTGFIGFGAYMFMIGSFVYWCTRLLVTRKLANQQTIFLTAILASYVSYLIYNFFLFSVVIIAIFFYLFPAMAFVFTEGLKPLKLKWPFGKVTFIVKGVVIFSTLYLLYSIFQLWRADVVFNAGSRQSELGQVGEAYNLLARASSLNKNEPLYRSEFAYTAAAAAALLKADASSSAELTSEALTQTQIVLQTSPNNISFWRTAIRTYFELSSLDPKYMEDTLNAIDTAIKLAPTDPKLYYNKALILESQKKKDESIQALKEALKLKPNYLEAQEALKEATASGKQP